MNRRSFLSLLASVPLLGRWVPKQAPTAGLMFADIVFPDGEVFIANCLREIPLWRAHDAVGLAYAGAIHSGYDPPFEEHSAEELDATEAFMRDTLLQLVRAVEALAHPPRDQQR